MNHWITADRVFDGTELRSDVALRITDGRVAEVVPKGTPPASVDARRIGALLSPGFFDIQVNGGGGVLFNRTPTPDGVRAIARAHRALGTTHILPTVITDAPEVMEAAAAAIVETCGSDGILGIHVEGPHIAQRRHGTHAPEFIRPLDDRTIGVLEKLKAANVPVLLTLAPEGVQEGQIERLTNMGVVVSIGHSDASLEQVRRAEAEGARAYTHLFNAMSQMENRAPGVVGAAITSHAYCSAIFDGFHVAPEMLRIACAARPVADRMILISDAMPTVGGPDSFELYGQQIRLRDGRLVNAQGSLAGAHIALARCVANAVELVGLPLQTALRMATSNPHRLMGTGSSDGLVGTSLTDMVLLDLPTGSTRPLEHRDIAPIPQAS